MANEPRVWNKRDPNVPKKSVYVGRPSIFGNPFRIGEDGTREEVIEAYRAHMSDDIKEIVRRELRGYHLVCWCAPKPCHADVLLEIANAD